MAALKILLVDDEPEILEILSDYFSDQQKYQVVTAENGAKAYKIARNQKFDLICTDYHMPKINGAELIFTLRNNFFNKETPIIVVTAYASDSIKELGKHKMELKQIEFIDKPINDQVFLEKVRNFIYIESSATDKVAQKNSAENTTTKQQTANFDVKFIQPFLIAATKTIKMLGQVSEIKQEKPYAATVKNMPRADISGTIQMNCSEFCGSLFVSFPKECFLKICSNMLGERYKEINAENQDAAAELSNIIFGSVKSTLNEMGYDLSPSLPSIILGDNHSLFTKDCKFSLVVPFQTEIGKFYLIINLENN